MILNNYKKTPGRGAMGVEVKADRIVHDFDEMKIARKPAEELRDAVERAIRGITETASDATMSRRRRAGIVGRRLFNATGKLAKGLAVVATRDGYETRAPADRLSGDSEGLAERLVEVAKLSARELMGDARVREAVQESVGEMIKVERGR